MTRFNLADAVSQIVVRKIDEEDLRVKVLAYYKGKSFSNPSPQALAKWTVNYIRHNLTEYDDTLWQVNSTTNSRDYLEYKIEVLRKIGVVYPNYIEEVMIQIDNLKGNYNSVPETQQITSKQYNIRRGDLWLAKLPCRDREDLYETKEVIVISNDKINKSSDFFVGIIYEKKCRKDI